ncbi:hypothetical protein [Streptomyces sp. MI02-7b]|nr:hypothetical protein [Streptomyces sp. MI02-7b]MDX3077627.1 hypothetical protein [Streptomyces sp. MI02-7b]
MGIVTSFDIEATELGDVIHARFAHEVQDVGAFLQAWGRGSPRAVLAS